MLTKILRGLNEYGARCDISLANLIGSISMLPQRKGSARWVNYNLRSWSEISKRIQQLLGNINNQGYYDYLAERFRCGALTD